MWLCCESFAKLRDRSSVGKWGIHFRSARGGSAGSHVLRHGQRTTASLSCTVIKWMYWPSREQLTKEWWWGRSAGLGRGLWMLAGATRRRDGSGREVGLRSKALGWEAADVHRHHSHFVSLQPSYLSFHPHIPFALRRPPLSAAPAKPKCPSPSIPAASWDSTVRGLHPPPRASGPR